MGGLDSKFKGPHGVFDLAMRAAEKGFRTIFNPFSKFVVKNNLCPVNTWPEADRLYFAEKWKERLAQGDPYYSPNLTLKLVDMGINSDIGDLER